jgi:hypothetical protein
MSVCRYRGCTASAKRGERFCADHNYAARRVQECSAVGCGERTVPGKVYCEAHADHLKRWKRSRLRVKQAQQTQAGQRAKQAAYGRAWREARKHECAEAGCEAQISHKAVYCRFDSMRRAKAKAA